MDTILYFYKKRGLQEPETEPVGLKTYLLIRIGLDVDPNQWFGRILGQIPHEGAPDGFANAQKAADCRAEAEKGLAGAAVREREENGKAWAVLCHPWKTLRQKRKERKSARREQARRREWEQEEARRLAERERLLTETEAAIRKLALEVEELAGGWQDCYCVYEDRIKKTIIENRNSAGVSAGQTTGGDWEGFNEEVALRQDELKQDVPQQNVVRRAAALTEEPVLPALWRKHFPAREFSGYRQRFWVEQLFPRAVLPHFIILGKAEGLPEVIEAYAQGMKSLRWILMEAEYDEELAVFVEDFYTEYGLAIELQLLEDTAALKRLRFFCKEAVNIVDFTGEAYMAVAAVPEGSIWLDMLSVEEKRHRILARGKKITYFSLKEIWKSAQKRCNCPVLP